MNDIKELEALEAHICKVTEEAKNATTVGTNAGLASITVAILAGAAFPIVGGVLGLVGIGIASAFLGKKIRNERVAANKTKQLRQELEQIWRDVTAGKYGTDESVIRPEIIPSEKERAIISIPTSNGTKRRVFERNASGEWHEVSFVGETQPFA